MSNDNNTETASQTAYLMGRNHREAFELGTWRAAAVAVHGLNVEPFLAALAENVSEYYNEDARPIVPSEREATSILTEACRITGRR